MRTTPELRPRFRRSSVVAQSSRRGVAEECCGARECWVLDLWERLVPRRKSSVALMMWLLGAFVLLWGCSFGKCNSLQIANKCCWSCFHRWHRSLVFSIGFKSDKQRYFPYNSVLPTYVNFSAAFQSKYRSSSKMANYTSKVYEELRSIFICSL